MCIRPQDAPLVTLPVYDLRNRHLLLLYGNHRTVPAMRTGKSLALALFVIHVPLTKASSPVSSIGRPRASQTKHECDQSPFTRLLYRHDCLSQRNTAPRSLSIRPNSRNGQLRVIANLVNLCHTPDSKIACQCPAISASTSCLAHWLILDVSRRDFIIAYKFTDASLNILKTCHSSALIQQQTTVWSTSAIV